MKTTTEIRLLAGVTLTELRRRAGAWRLPAVGAALFALIFIGLGLTTEIQQDRAAARTFRVAVEGDMAGAQDFLSGLQAYRLSPTERDDASYAVQVSEAALGLRLPPDLDRRLDAGEPVTIEVLNRRRHNTSREALALFEQAIAGSDPGQTAVSPVTFEVLELDEQSTLNRDDFARTLTAMVALLCLGVVTAVASILGGARDRRIIQPLLLLPLNRRNITSGIAVGAYPMVAVQLAVGIAVLLATALLPLPRLGLSLSTVQSMVLPALGGALLLSALATAVGVLAGALGGGTDDAMGLGDLMGMPFLALGVALLVAPDLGDGLWGASVPGLGPLTVIRSGVAGSFDAVAAAVALAVTAVVTAGLLTLAARQLGNERRVLRTSS